ncbi:MAG: Fe-S cluster assembly ATPase SufC [Candidatus Jacksonbacteria bacterium]
MSNGLIINNLFVKIQNKEILKGISLVLGHGEIHALMGPNGSGKSTLARAIMGHLDCKISQGQMRFDDQNLLKMIPDKRARAGVFLAFQEPIEVPGVNVFEFLRAVYPEPMSVDEFVKKVKFILKDLNIKKNFLERDLHQSFSGGEKKKLEILQMAVLKPKLIILDEIDSGLDIDALRTVSSAIKKYRIPESIVLIITHYQKVLKYIKPDFVHVMVDGRIVESGDWRLARRVEKEGYKWIVQSSKCKVQN